MTNSRKSPSALLSKVTDFLRRTKNTSRLGVGLYSVFILQSLLQFLSLIILEQTLEKGEFSSISYVFTLFTPYFFIVDMGLQADLIRRFSLAKSPAEILPAIIRLRIVAAILGIIAMVIHGLVGQVAPATLIAMLFYGFTLLPAGLLYSYESLGYARDDFLEMISLRLTRIIGLLSYTSVVVISTKYITAWSYETAIVGLLLFPLITGFFAILVCRRHRTNSMKSKITSPFTAWQLFKENRNLAISALLSWLFAAAFWALCVRLYGDKQMAEINVANMLTIPIALKVQVVNGLFAARRFRQVDSKESDVQKKRRFVISIAFLTTSIVAIYSLILAIPGLIPLVFANIDTRYIWPALLMFLGAQPFIAISAYLSAEAVHAKKTEILLIGPLVALAVLAGGYVFISRGLLPKEAILGLFLLANALVCAVYLLKLRQGKGDKLPVSVSR
ncbi:MAG: hypothetical protein ACOH5I_24535 [Oligoflexus sp.]